MSAYFIVSYDVSNPAEYAKYNPGSMGTIMKTLGRHGGEVVAAGENTCTQGAQRDVLVVLKFPNAEAAQAWHEDPEYAGPKQIRLSATTNINAYLINEFVMPG